MNHDPDTYPNLDLERRRLVRALRDVLADRSVNDETKAREIDATISAIRQIATLAGIPHGQ